jgi:hypothetical protein
MRLPKSFDEFTVGQFMDWHKIMSEKPVEGDEDFLVNREYKLLAMLLGITVEQCEAIPFGELRPLLRELNLIQFSKPSEKINRVIRINGKFYIPVINPKDLRELLSASQYTAYKEYTKSDPIEHMDKILASLYTPFKWFRKPKLTDTPQQLADEMRQAKIGDVAGFVFFCERQYKELMKASQPYFEQAAQIIKERMEEMALVQEQGL